MPKDKLTGREKTPFQELREGFRHSLLDWKDKNIEQFKDKFGERGLNQLNHAELFYLAGRIHGEDVRELLRHGNFVGK